MAVSYIATRPITLGGHLYAAGDTVDTTGWASNTISVMIRMGWIAASGSYEPVANSGLFSALPSTGTGSKAFYFATDLNGGTLFQDLTNGGSYSQVAMGNAQSGGRELARTVYTTASQGFTAEADLTGMSVTFTVAARPVDVVGFIPVAAQGTAGGQLMLKITDGSNAETARALVAVTTQVVASTQLRAEERITTAGTYTRKLRASNNGSTGTVTIYGTATAAQFAPYISVVER